MTKCAGGQDVTDAPHLQGPFRRCFLTRCPTQPTQVVGRGGYSMVHKGRRRADGLPCAVKKIEIFELSAKKRERCLAEVKLLQQLSHPHIVTMVDAFVADNTLVIVIEWAGAGGARAPADPSIYLIAPFSFLARDTFPPFHWPTQNDD